jgi:hypothetical protein
LDKCLVSDWRFGGLLQTLDSAFLQYSVGRMLERHTGVHLLFAFEYIILSSIVISIFLKHMLAVIDNYLEVRELLSHCCHSGLWVLVPSVYDILCHVSKVGILLLLHIIC